MFAKVALDEGVGAIEIGFWRAVFGASLFAAHTAVTRLPLPSGRDLGASLLFGLAGISLFYCAYQLAVEAGGASLPSVLLYTAPALVAVYSIAVLGLKFTWALGSAILATMVGVGCISLGGGDGIVVNGAVFGWGMVAATTYASYYIFGNTYFQRYQPPAIMAVALPVVVVTLFPFTEFSSKSALAWASLAAIGLLSTYVAYLAHGAGLQRMAPTHASVVSALEPVIAAAAAAVLFGERLSLLGLLGAALVICAAVGLGVQRTQPRS